MVSEEVRRLYEAVKELKSQNEGLVGTQDVWKALKHRREVYEGPGILAEGINRELSDRLDEVTYSASPERVWGINQGLFVTLIPEEGDDFPFTGRETLLHLYSLENIDYRNFLTSSWEIYFQDSDSDEYRDSVECVTPIFTQANLDGVRKDDEFGASFASLIRNSYGQFEGILPAEFRNYYQQYIDSFALNVAVADWPEIMSRETFIKEQNERAKDMFDGCFDVPVMAARIMNDMVENKMEYRRRLLAHVIYKFQNEQGLIGLADFNIGNWEDLVKYRKLKQDVGQNIEPALEYLESIGMCDAELGALELELKRSDNANRLIHRIIGQERNWINKFLKGG